jgi:hypothetical protein
LLCDKFGIVLPFKGARLLFDRHDGKRVSLPHCRHVIEASDLGADLRSTSAEHDQHHGGEQRSTPGHHSRKGDCWHLLSPRILAWREERTVTRNLTLRYDRMMLLLDPTPFARELADKTVEVVNYPDGRFAVRYEGGALPFRVFDKIQTVAAGAIVENKRLGAALAFARELQASYPPNRRRGDPRRHRPPNNLETPCMPTKGRPSRKVLAAAAAK